MVIIIEFVSDMLSIELGASHLVIEQLRGAERGKGSLVGDNDVLLILLVPLAAVAVALLLHHGAHLGVGERLLRRGGQTPTEALHSGQTYSGHNTG